MLPLPLPLPLPLVAARGSWALVAGESPLRSRPPRANARSSQQVCVGICATAPRQRIEKAATGSKPLSGSSSASSGASGA